MAKSASHLVFICALAVAMAKSATAQVAPPSLINPVPLIYQPLMPTSVSPGGQEFKLNVIGTGLTASSVVNWNGVALPSTLVNRSSISAVVAAGLVASAGTASITVSNPPPGGGTSNVEYLPVANTPFFAPTFSRAYLTTPYAGVCALVVTDFNADGHPDIAAISSFNFVFVLVGNGDGTFQPAANYPVGNGPNSVVAADFNGDGTLDLAVVNGSDGTVSVLLGNGDGTFAPQKKYAAGSSPGTLLAADVNGDGKLDLIVSLAPAPPPKGMISVLLGNGDGTFEKGAHYDTGGENVDTMTAGDFNNDGIVDVVAFDHNIDSASVLLGIGEGGFGAPAFFKFPAQAVFESALPIDFNGDGNLDLAVTWGWSRPQAGIFVMLGNGNGAFPSIHNFISGFSPMGLGAGDFNADGVLDLAVTDWNAEDFAVLLGEHQDTGFDPPLGYSTGTTPEGLALGDFNGDGKLDAAIALPNGGYSSIAIFLQQ